MENRLPFSGFTSIAPAEPAYLHSIDRRVKRRRRFGYDGADQDSAPPAETRGRSMRPTERSATIRRGRARPVARAAARAARAVAEAVERRVLLAADPVISEFLALNDNGITDADGEHSDWIEIHNRGDEPANMAGWHLTDGPGDKEKWTFP